VWTKPGRIFQNVLVAAGGAQNYDFGWNKVGELGLTVFQGTLRNFWQFKSTFIFLPPTLNNQSTRGGPMALSPSGWEEEFNLSTDARQHIVLGGP
jgi:hypothetical protein